MKTIYMDESGNTGSNLLDNNQPVFATASCDFSLEEAEHLLGILSSASAAEVHFKRLKKSPRGRDEIIRLLSDDLVSPCRTKIYVIHKEFMALAKILDTLVEYYYDVNGYDFYKHGRNIAYSNLLWYCLPVFCNAEQVRTVYSTFLAMVCNASPSTIDAFYGEVNNLRKH